MSELTLKDKLNELTSIVKVLEKTPELSADVETFVSYGGKVYARIFRGRDGLDFEVY